MESEFDFIKAFADVDLLQAEAVAKVVGRVHASLFEGMVAGGLSENTAYRILRGAHAEMFQAMLTAGRDQ